MRAIVTAGVACLMLAVPCAAETDKSKEAASTPSAKPLTLKQPTSKDECLQTLEAVFAHALEADLLDDQAEEAELHLERLEVACLDGNFADALIEAKAVERIVATNK